MEELDPSAVWLTFYDLPAEESRKLLVSSYPLDQTAINVGGVLLEGHIIRVTLYFGKEHDALTGAPLHNVVRVGLLPLTTTEIKE